MQTKGLQLTKKDSVLLLPNFLVGWGGRIRTHACKSQSLAPYRLATPQCNNSVAPLQVWCKLNTKQKQKITPSQKLLCVATKFARVLVVFVIVLFLWLVCLPAWQHFFVLCWVVLFLPCGILHGFVFVH